MISGEQKRGVDCPWAWINKEGHKDFGQSEKGSLKMKAKSFKAKWGCCILRASANIFDLKESVKCLFRVLFMCAINILTWKKD